MGKIFLNRLQACAVIGTLPHERIAPQRLFLDVEISAPFMEAAVSDDLMKALDDSALEKEIIETVEKSSFFLLEALLNAVGNVIIAHKEVNYCRVRIEKPQATQVGRSVAVEAVFSAEGMDE